MTRTIVTLLSSGVGLITLVDVRRGARLCTLHAPHGLWALCWPRAWRLLSPWDLSSLWLLCFLLDGHYALHTLLMPNANSIASHCPRQSYQHSFLLPLADRLCEHTNTLLSKVRLGIRTDSNIVSSRRNHITMLIPFTAREIIPEPRLYYSRRAEP